MRLRLLACLMIVLLGCAKKEEVKFAAFDDASFQAAKAMGKPAVVFATADWCPPCRELHRGALTDEDVKKALEPFARLEIDCSDKSDRSNNDKLRQFGLHYLPALVFFDRSGNETDRFEGPPPAKTIIAAAKKASQ